MPNLILILGDQLDINISSLAQFNKNDDHILMCEVAAETSYVKHHKQKIIFILSAMRHFSNELKKSGYRHFYVKLDDPNNTGSFKQEVIRHMQLTKCEKVIITKPGEYRVFQELNSLNDSDCMVDWRDDGRFISSPKEFKSWASNKKQIRMEGFYRHLRAKHNVLMSADKPLGGKWNYDKDNRKPIKSKSSIPSPKVFKPDQITNEVIELVEYTFADHFGDSKSFNYAVTRKQALSALNDFLCNRIHLFGDYQDAMLCEEPYLYHSVISLYLNVGLLNPKEVIKKTEQLHRNGSIPINSAEGFIRQILGWREFIRGIYWLKMPEYASSNYLNAHNSLPEFFWSGNTELNCLQQCIKQTKQYAYAHHIQRLMVLGNFLLLTGIHPEVVNEWYLIVYIDAFEWVELPNVTGMILFADGGYLASKPYAASGSYINKMSNYCNSCKYHVKEKNGEQACPFNYLYWNFLDKHREKLSINPRLAMIYKTLDKMDNARLEKIREDAKSFIQTI